VEASTLSHVERGSLVGPTPLLRIQSDERLVALTRDGNQAAYEALVARYQARLLAFCRHMLGSREDAEDVLQEVFAAAFNAMIADERPLNVRPWLYRIARNRSLNHLRRVQAIGVDSMDVHFSENGASTADKVHKREEFRLLVQDVQGLPETQRTALLLREIDALSYDQIAEAMDTTVPSVKSLLVRARVSLAESAEARRMTCDEVREELGEVAEGLQRMSPPVRRHLRGCDRCAGFRKHLRANNRALAAVFPVGPLLLFKKLLLANLGTTASASSGAAAAGAGASAAGAGGALSAGMGAIAGKAAAGIAAAAIVTAGAVEVDHVSRRPLPRHATPVAAATATVPATPHVIAAQPQPAAVQVPPRRHKAAVTPDKKDDAGTDAKDASKRNAAQSPTAPAKEPQTSDNATVPPPQQGSATVTLPQQQPTVPGSTGADETATTPAPPPPAPPAAGADPVTTQPAPTPPPATTPPPADPAPPPADGAPAPPPADGTPPPADPPQSGPPQPGPPQS
jgi:RNA polymerase sigma factor (sigma-70 family)